MSDDRRRYARFYYEQFLVEYPDIWDNSTVMGDWLKLLVAAEQSWPADPDIPRAVRRSSLTVLTDAGIVQVVGHRFHLRGFRAERQRRSTKASNAARSRWDQDRALDDLGNALDRFTSNANGNAPSTAPTMPSTRTSTRRELEGIHGAKATDAGARPAESLTR